MSSQGSTALKPSPRPFWRLHYSLRESFGLVPWGNEAFVTLVPVCAHLSPGFPKKFQNSWEQFWPFDYESTNTWDCHQVLNAGGQGEEGGTRSSTSPEAPAKSREASWVRDKCSGDVSAGVGTPWDVGYSLHKAKSRGKTTRDLNEHLPR